MLPTIMKRKKRKITDILSIDDIFRIEQKFSVSKFTPERDIAIKIDKLLLQCLIEKNEEILKRLEVLKHV